MAQNKKTFKRGVNWTDEEHQRLLSEFNAGTSVKDIATSHDRTVKAIEYRLSHAAAEEVMQGAPMAEVASKYHVTESMVDRKLRQLQTIKQPSMKDRVTQLEQRVAQLEQYITQLTGQGTQ